MKVYHVFHRSYGQIFEDEFGAKFWQNYGIKPLYRLRVYPKPLLDRRWFRNLVRFAALLFCVAFWALIFWLATRS